MQRETVFVEAAQAAGFSAHAAAAALAEIAERLRQRGSSGATFYIYRTASPAAPAAPTAPPPPTRPRVLLAFRSADAALSFAQHSGLSRSPRVMRLGLPQLLAVLLQRPNIGSLLFADDVEDVLTHRGLPPGLRLERSMLLELLA